MRLCFVVLQVVADGESLPLGNLELSSLKFLTVEQALKDAAVLIEYLQAQLPIEYNVTHLRPANAKYKVVAFGGSYSGALSAWFRVAYPEHTVGSLSSSGVVNAVSVSLFS